MQRIAVIGEATYHFNRRTIRGLSEAMHRRGPFVMRFHPSNCSTRQLITWLDRVQPTGVVTTSQFTPAFARHLQSRGVPSVSVNMPWLFAGAGRVMVDDRSIGALAARFFLGRGASHFAFVSYDWAAYHQARLRAFARVLAESNQTVHTYLSDTAPGTLDGDRDPRPPKSLQKFLTTLPKPCSLLAGNDAIASVVLEQCQQIGIAVPREISILGVDDNPDVCLTSSPRLSTIGLPLLDMGRQIAAMFVRAEAGGGEPLGEFVASVNDVIERETTEIYVPRDPQVEQAMIYIHAHARGPLPMKKLRELTGLSASKLSERFRRAIGRTPMMELRRQRVEVARSLLRDTNESIHDIAIDCGFKSARYFSMVFRELAQTTPSAYRNSHQDRS